MTSLQRPMMIGKIHRATVTQADLHYVGSITIDKLLLEAADLCPGQQVDVVDVTNGSRLTTYVIPGEPGSGQICINGAAAHLVHPGDTVIIIAYGMLADAEARTTSRTSCSSTRTTGSSRSPATRARSPTTAASCTGASCPAVSRWRACATDREAAPPGAALPGPAGRWWGADAAVRLGSPGERDPRRAC